MNIIKICTFCFIALFLILVVKENNKSIAMFISIVAGTGLLIYSILNTEGIIKTLQNLSSGANVEAKYLSLVLKIAGITYLVEFGKNICVDSGELSLGTKLELAGKIMIVTLTIPILNEILSKITGLL